MPQISSLDPHSVNGEPFEVAAFAGVQAIEVVDFTMKRVEEFEWAACNAWMTAEYHRTRQMPDPDEFGESPQGRRFIAAKRNLTEAASLLKILKVAAEYDPSGR